MAEFDRLTECIEWIDVSFVARERTPGWAIQVGIRYHLEYISTKYASQYIDELGIQRSHVAVHNWVHKVDLQPVSTASADQLAVDEKLTRINGTDHWLYGAVGPGTNELLQFRHFPTTKQTTRWVPAELHRRYRLDDVEFLVDDADHLVNVLEEVGHRFQMISHGNRNAIERVFWKIERRTYLFTNSFNHVEPTTAESWLKALAVRHNSRQTSHDPCSTTSAGATRTRGLRRAPPSLVRIVSLPVRRTCRPAGVVRFRLRVTIPISVPGRHS